MLSPSYIRTRQHRRESAKWSPANLNNLFAWWDFGDESTITFIGIKLLQIADKSGNGRNLSTSTGNAPETSSDSPTGTHCGEFYDDSLIDHLWIDANAGSVLTPNNFSIAGVMYVDTNLTDPNSQADRVFGTRGQPVAAGGLNLLADDFDPGSGTIPGVYPYYVDDSASLYNVAYGPDKEWFQFCITWDINRTDELHINLDGNKGTYQVGSGQLRVGSIMRLGVDDAQWGVVYTNGDFRIGEWIMTDSTLTTGEQDLMSDYFADRWGVPSIGHVS